MKILSSFLVLIFSFVGYSQKMTVDRPDEILEPDPFKTAYFMDKNEYKGIEAIAVVSKYKYNAFNPDTLNVTYFNEKGLKSKVVRYKKNIPSTTTVFTYSKADDLLSWEMFDKNYSTITYYKYTSNHQLIQTRQLRIKRKNNLSDSTFLSSISFEYDGDNLVEILHLNSITESYEFLENQLEFKKGGSVSKSFEYDSRSNLIGINEYMGSEISVSKLMGIKSFTYDKFDRLIADSILTSANLIEKKYQITNYGYVNDKSKTPETINVSYDGYYRNIKLEYAKDRLKNVFVSTNQSNNAYLRMWLNHRIAQSYTMPIKYKEEFEYDKKGNKTLKKTFVNNDLFSEIEFLITYR